MTQIIDGKARAKELRKELKGRVSAFVEQSGYPPGLGVLLVGEDPASAVYVRNKERACAKVGIQSFHHQLPREATQEQVEAVIDQLNADAQVHGILLQLPLPEHLDAEPLLLRILPEKDADGFHPVNAGLLAVGQPRFVPCTPLGCVDLLKWAGVEIQGAEAVVVGRSNIVGKPAAQLLLAEGATVTICHSKTKDLASHVGRADIVVAAVGVPEMIKGEWIKEGAAVIDVGINRLDDGRLVGDVEFESAKQRAGGITPVPGGVGPMTVAKLLENTLDGAIRQEAEKQQTV
ncbi:MAG: bifunctional methylenetetrahydrofolate dehydrogenase/methenyltetrahydrofolate cyclohydrolase FolD [Planctomycetia bacterium]|nr:bifunctional methylenetetrahydrofolate dehydrogenase/methenyltetrahydrofolate cyclohydrolase FolD [Planctomycetia bacterium]MBL6915405.1 bifunctional methylenetetrahydrofolate dehydrogenase/methenyltetrahydrofolate cyclohydrolase FolD [Planctomycetota bacterium]HCW45786.1 bifunctional methylenetetrahydrofolate dehydrogenase/methenyltetrahydrofolate cyclohydrolase FolD [Planctomycetota bacterium]